MFLLLSSYGQPSLKQQPYARTNLSQNPISKGLMSVSDFGLAEKFLERSTRFLRQQGRDSASNSNRLTQEFRTYLTVTGNELRTVQMVGYGRIRVDS